MRPNESTRTNVVTFVLLLIDVLDLLAHTLNVCGHALSLLTCVGTSDELMRLDDLCHGITDKWRTEWVTHDEVKVWQGIAKAYVCAEVLCKRPHRTVELRPHEVHTHIIKR
jgi:hypothetical protein